MSAGARDAFHAEALPHLDAVYRFALRLSSSPDLAQDLVQETFLRAYRSWDQYTPGTRCKSWLFTICRNLYLRQWQRGRKQEQVLQEMAEEGPAVVGTVNPIWIAAADSDPEGRFYGELVDQEVLMHVEALPQEFRVVVLLSDLEGLTYQEIADLLEVPVGTVKSRLFRGRRRLQSDLYDYAVEAGYVGRASSGSEMVSPRGDGSGAHPGGGPS